MVSLWSARDWNTWILMVFDIFADPHSSISYGHIDLSNILNVSSLVLVFTSEDLFNKKRWRLTY